MYPSNNAPVYPVYVRGDLDEPLSRWLWLVKWILAIPHYLVLVFLWIAFVVLTVVAGLMILFTGRYPRGIFDFNVGVLRWMWRVEFYAFSPIGTDRYPPFTLRSTDYPADLQVDYPARLSRGLVLVKWWLLVIPHYLIVSAMTSTGTTISWGIGNDSGKNGSAGFSLLGLLVLISVVALLFTARYPRHLFDFIVGINRWSYRVMAYTALMRDEYPPFRLDQGPREPSCPPREPTYR